MDRSLMLELIAKHAQIKDFNQTHTVLANRLAERIEQVSLFVNAKLDNLTILLSELEEVGNGALDDVLLLSLDVVQSLPTRRYHRDECAKVRLSPGHIRVLKRQLADLATLPAVENATKLLEFDKVRGGALWQ